MNRETGDSDHWDVQRKDGRGYINIGKNGNKWGGRGKEPNIPKMVRIGDIGQAVVEGVAIAAGSYLIWVGIKWAAAIILAPSTAGGSLILIAIP